MMKKLFLIALNLVSYVGFSQVSASAIANNILCFGDNSGSITVFATGGTSPYIYSIDNGVSFINSNIFNSLAAGNYFVIVKDANNILSSQINATISSPSPLNLIAQVTGSTVTLIASGGAPPYSSAANSGPYQSSPVFSNLLDGFFVFQVRDSNGCIATISLYVSSIPSLRLVAFLDIDNDGVKDNNENNFPNATFSYVKNNNGIINYLNPSTGESNIQDSNTSNSYNITHAINDGQNLCYSSSPTNFSNITTAAGVQTLYFPVTTISACTDLEVSLLNYATPPRPGFVYENQIVYKNYGNQTIASGTITFNKDVLLGNIISTIPSGGFISGNSMTFSFTNLLPNESRILQVKMQVPNIPTINLGQLVINTTSITISTSDFNTLNNASSLTETVVGSYDPNDKLESHGDKILHSAFTSNDFLTYTVRFENTGTANAENVRINDLLDNKLDEASIKTISASHAYTLERVGTNLNWRFNGIELPPSVANTNIGHGYVTFQIKPKAGYAVGDIIPNSASIFFDFNPAIVTNTFTTEFVAALGVASFENNAFKLFPNPTNGVLNIHAKNNLETINAITVNDVLGKTVQIIENINNSATTINLTNLSKGIYFVKINSDKTEKVFKIIKD